LVDAIGGDDGTSEQSRVCRRLHRIVGLFITSLNIFDLAELVMGAGIGSGNMMAAASTAIA